MKINFSKVFEDRPEKIQTIDARKPRAIAVSISVLILGIVFLAISAKAPISREQPATAPVITTPATIPPTNLAYTNINQPASHNESQFETQLETLAPSTLNIPKLAGDQLPKKQLAKNLQNEASIEANTASLSTPFLSPAPVKRIELANGILVPRIKPATEAQLANAQIKQNTNKQTTLTKTIPTKNNITASLPIQKDKFTPNLKPSKRSKTNTIAPSRLAQNTSPKQAANFKIGNSRLHTHPLNLHPVKAFNPSSERISVFSTVDVTPNHLLETTPHRATLINFEGDLTIPPQEYDLTLKSGENFVDLLKRANVRREDRNQAALAFGKHMRLRSLQAGLRIKVVTAQANQTYFQAITTKNINHHLLSLSVQTPDNETLTLSRAPSGVLEAHKKPIKMKRRLQIVSGVINGNLYTSMRNQNTPDDIIHALANIFAFDVDFQRDIFSGDQFEAIFEAIYDEEGKLVGGGDIVFARLTWRGNKREKNYYLYDPKNKTQNSDYFDGKGQSARRLLMKTPVDGARLSSNFGPRRHPILGYRKTHKGVDFAARRGTPIKATGDGIIERANRFGSYGNYIRIRHSNNYKTAYAHLKGFARGIKKGRRVRQGDIIGYIGTTGRSTGPHLHYEVHHKNKPVNPQKLKIATGIKLTGKALNGFKQNRSLLDALRVPREELIKSAKNDLAYRSLKSGNGVGKTTTATQ